MDDRVVAADRIQLSRPPELAQAICETFPCDLYPREQDCWLAAARFRLLLTRQQLYPTGSARLETLNLLRSLAEQDVLDADDLRRLADEIDD